MSLFKGGLANALGGFVQKVGGVATNLVTAGGNVATSVANTQAGSMLAAGLAGKMGTNVTNMGLQQPAQYAGRGTGSSTGKKLSWFEKTFNMYKLVDGVNYLNDQNGDETFNYANKDGASAVNEGGEKVLDVVKIVLTVVIIGSIVGVLYWILKPKKSGIRRMSRRTRR